MTVQPPVSITIPHVNHRSCTNNLNGKNGLFISQGNATQQWEKQTLDYIHAVTVGTTCTVIVQVSAANIFTPSAYSAKGVLSSCLRAFNFMRLLDAITFEQIELQS